MIRRAVFMTAFHCHAGGTDPAYAGVIKAMYGLEEPLAKSSLEPALRELVKSRASQITRRRSMGGTGWRLRRELRPELIRLLRWLRGSKASGIFYGLD
jgi:hypothetical protein